MNIPPTLRIGVLVLVATAFYTYVGQMVPQSEVHPPAEIVLRSDLTTAEMVTVGREIMEGKGLCFTCHTVGRTGALRFPDLEGIGARAGTTIPGMSDVEYLAQSMHEPDIYIVEGFNPGMPAVHRPPIGLTEEEILSVIAHLQSLGGTPTVTLATRHRYNAGAATPGAAPAPAAVPAEGAVPDAPPAEGAAPDASPAEGAAPATAAPAAATPQDPGVPQ